MKIWAILLLSAVHCFGQQTSPSYGTMNSIDFPPSVGEVTTTPEEYNYCLNGYHKDIADSRDIKDGYEIVGTSVYQKNGGLTKAYFTPLIRKSDEAVCAIMVHLWSKSKLWNTEHSEYLCIPVNDSKLYQEHFSSLRLKTLEFKDIYSEALIYHLSLNPGVR